MRLSRWFTKGKRPRKRSTGLPSWLTGIRWDLWGWRTSLDLIHVSISLDPIMRLTEIPNIFLAPFWFRWLMPDYWEKNREKDSTITISRIEIEPIAFS